MAERISNTGAKIGVFLVSGILMSVFTILVHQVRVNTREIINHEYRLQKLEDLTPKKKPDLILENE